MSSLLLFLIFTHIVHSLFICKQFVGQVEQLGEILLIERKGKVLGRHTEDVQLSHGRGRQTEVKLSNVRTGGFQREIASREAFPVKLTTLSVPRRSHEGERKLAQMLAARSFCDLLACC